MFIQTYSYIYWANEIIIMKLFRNLSYLTKSQIASYNRNGYLVLPNMIPLTDSAQVKLRLRELIDA